VLIALVIVALVLSGVALGIVLARARRSLETALIAERRLRRPPEAEVGHEAGPKPSMLGTADQRLKALWLAVYLSGGGVLFLAIGAAFLGEVLLVIGVMLALQVCILGAIARLRGAPEPPSGSASS
jgi:hypothetical protein